MEIVARNEGVVVVLQQSIGEGGIVFNLSSLSSLSMLFMLPIYGV